MKKVLSLVLLSSKLERDPSNAYGRPRAYERGSVRNVVNVLRKENGRFTFLARAYSPTLTRMLITLCGREDFEDLDYDVFISLEVDVSSSFEGLEDKALSEEAPTRDCLGERCELQTFESRQNSRGDAIMLQVGTRDYIAPEIRYGADPAALVLIRYFSTQDQRKLESTTLLVQSPHIRAALREVIKTYPAVNFDTANTITLFGQPRCLFHYRKELEEYTNALQDGEAKRHMTLCLQYASKAMYKEISQYQTMMQGVEASRSLEYSLLWMVFKPGDLICVRTFDGELTIARCTEVRLETGKAQSPHSPPPPPGTVPQWCISGENITCIGRKLTYTNCDSYIEEYEGVRCINSLRCFPLEYLDNKEQMIERYLSRGRIYLSLAGIQHRYYDGVASLFPRKGPISKMPPGVPKTPRHKDRLEYWNIGYRAVSISTRIKPAPWLIEHPRQASVSW
jgi:hypothetical protein